MAVRKERSEMEQSRADFLKRWIPMGIKLWSECEGHGINWREHRLEELDFLIDLAKIEMEDKCAKR